MKLFKHLKTVHKHRKEVRKLCFKCGLYWQGLIHDLSKYSPTELIPSVKYYTGTRSPIDNQIDDIGYSEAWLHHKGRNKHHYEYWQDDTHGHIRCDIPYRYIVEMFCDRVAACKVYQKDKYTPKSALKYFLENFNKEDVSEQTYDRLYYLLYMLARDGEKIVCKHIREDLKYIREKRKEVKR